MFILQFLSNPIVFFLFLAALITAVSVHEFAHAKTADHLGDPTAQLAGRVTLNPLAHLDTMGSILFLLIGFGWGKPVPFDLFNLKNPRRDSALISLAGPTSNFILALASAILLKSLQLFTLPIISNIGLVFLTWLIYTNIVLGLFNLLPVAPLDGFKIVGGFLPKRKADEWYSLERYGIIFLLFFIFPLFGNKSMLEIFLIPIVQFLIGILV